MKDNINKLIKKSTFLWVLIGLVTGYAGALAYMHSSQFIHLESSLVSTEQKNITCSLDYSLITDNSSDKQSSFSYKMIGENEFNDQSLEIKIEGENLEKFSLPLTNFPNDSWELDENNEDFLVVDYLVTDNEANSKLNDKQQARFVLDKANGYAVLTRSLHNKNSENYVYISSASYFFSCN